MTDVDVEALSSAIADVMTTIDPIKMKGIARRFVLESVGLN
jgi:hypothetical protein